MIPYAEFGYFGILLYAVVPVFIPKLGLRFGRVWILLATLGMLVVQYWAPLQLTPSLAMRELWLVAGYAIWQAAITFAFLRLRPRVASPWPYYAALGLSLLPLIAAKLTPVVAPGDEFGFLGISWVTFRALDLVFLGQDKLLKRLSLAQFFAYLFFFPTLSSGPIDRFRRFEKDWSHTRNGAEFLADLDAAVQRLFRGFLYKFILAALIQRYWLDPLTGSDALSTVSYMYGYGLYLFFDFAGYTAFAIAVSLVFGVHTPENFNRPFLARDVKDFWARWNMTLSTWFRDHVYMRFLLTATKRKWFTDRYVASSVGYLLLFGLMGLWHGPQLHYIVYGLYHAGLMIGYEWFARWAKTRTVWGSGPLWTVAAIAVTVQAVFLGFLIFSGRLF